MLSFFNTLTHQKIALKEHKKNEIKLYVCGITPYDFAHIGHGRCYVVFDFLYRFFSTLSYKVTYCRNYTDIDDKLLHKSEKLYGTKTRYLEIAALCIKQFQKDMTLLNCLTPTYEPRVTENIPAIIDFITHLIKKGAAYESQGDVYFSVEQFRDYGKLSKQNTDELLLGTRHNVREEKRNPLDFALWKKETEDFFWQSPWGNGRPGWHIECSALAKKYLGEYVDIHGGGLDLIFPHHENEIAQSESFLEHEFVKIWMHIGLVMSNTEKMSKSLGNIIFLKDILVQYDPMIVRYYYLAHHYRSPLPFSYESLEAHEKAYKKLCTIFSSDISDTEILKNEHPLIKRMMHALFDDVNTPELLGIIFENMAIIKEDTVLRCAVKTILKEIFGLLLQRTDEKIEYSEEVKNLLNERENARKEKNWQRADEIRETLTAMGIEVKDKKI